MAVKLFGETDSLHIRAYIDTPPPALSFASTSVMPTVVRRLTIGFNQRMACQSASFIPGALYFDADQNHDAWSTTLHSFASALVNAPSASGSTLTTSNPAPAAPVSVPPSTPRRSPLSDDGAAEAAQFDQAEVDAIAKKVEAGDFAVPDTFTTSKTRGSAQQVFARAVKRNYGNRCAITGISTKDFLVASHIVPWADDESIRTDPSNGICLSTLVDRAFDAGYLSIGVDGIVKIHVEKLKDDSALAAALTPYDGAILRSPKAAPPNAAYLDRRLSRGQGR